jgi:hypothetical protein
LISQQLVDLEQNGVPSKKKKKQRERKRNQRENVIKTIYYHLMKECVP